jgi:hypothetical protein
MNKSGKIVGGKIGARSMAFKLMIEKGHSIDSLMSADRFTDLHCHSQNIRRFFTVKDGDKRTKVGGEMRKVDGKTVHVGGLAAWGDFSGMVRIGHSMCHPNDVSDKLIGSQIADLQAGLCENEDAIPATFKLSDVESFMERCVKYFNKKSVAVVVWVRDENGKSVRALLEMTEADVKNREAKRKKKSIQRSLQTVSKELVTA